MLKKLEYQKKNFLGRLNVANMPILKYIFKVSANSNKKTLACSTQFEYFWSTLGSIV